METNESIHDAIGKDVIHHAKALGLSTHILYKWMEPHTDFTESGAFNPLDRLITVSRTALRCGKPEAEALSPLQCYAHEFHRVILEVPKAIGSTKEITEELSKVMKEFSDLTAETAHAIEDGRISAPEAERIHKEVWHLIQSAVIFERNVQESVK
jgi:hypothetical protein